MKRTLNWKQALILALLISVKSHAVSKPVDATNTVNDEFVLSLVAVSGGHGTCIVKRKSDVDWQVSANGGRNFSFGSLGASSAFVLRTLNTLGMCKEKSTIKLGNLTDLDDGILIAVSQAGGTGRCVASYHDHGNFSLTVDQVAVDTPVASWGLASNALRNLLNSGACDNDKLVVNNK